jgi:hypothetical protein
MFFCKQLLFLDLKNPKFGIFLESEEKYLNVLLSLRSQILAGDSRTVALLSVFIRLWWLQNFSGHSSWRLEYSLPPVLWSVTSTIQDEIGEVCRKVIQRIS